MFVKLLGCMSYSYDKYMATKNKPTIEVPDDIGNYLVSTGRFAVLSTQEENSENTSQKNPTISTSDIAMSDTKSINSESFGVSSISKMKVAELESLAEQLGIEFDAGLSKAEKISKISDFLKENDL